MKAATEKRIKEWWTTIENLYTSNEITESQYLTQNELLKSLIFNAKTED